MVEQQTMLATQIEQLQLQAKRHTLQAKQQAMEIERLEALQKVPDCCKAFGWSQEEKNKCMVGG